MLECRVCWGRAWSREAETGGASPDDISRRGREVPVRVVHCAEGGVSTEVVLTEGYMVWSEGAYIEGGEVTEYVTDAGIRSRQPSGWRLRAVETIGQQGFEVRRAAPGLPQGASVFSATTERSKAWEPPCGA